MSVRQNADKRATSSPVAAKGKEHAVAKTARKSAKAAKHEKVVEPIAVESCLHLLQLGLPGCGDLTNSGLASLVNGLPASLTVLKLELSSNLNLTDAGIVPLAKKLRGLPKKPDLMCNFESTSVGDGRVSFRSLFDVEVWQMGQTLKESRGNSKRGSVAPRGSLAPRKSAVNPGRKLSAGSLLPDSSERSPPSNKLTAVPESRKSLSSKPKAVGLGKRSSSTPAILPPLDELSDGLALKSAVKRKP
jgi:hypothetical protein